jgi:hypothetical protein
MKRKYSFKKTQFEKRDDQPGPPNSSMNDSELDTDS